MQKYLHQENMDSEPVLSFIDKKEIEKG